MKDNSSLKQNHLQIKSKNPILESEISIQRLRILPEKKYLDLEKGEENNLVCKLLSET